MYLSGMPILVWPALKSAQKYHIDTSERRLLLDIKGLSDQVTNYNSFNRAASRAAAVRVFTSNLPNTERKWAWTVRRLMTN